MISGVENQAYWGRGGYQQLNYRSHAAEPVRNSSTKFIEIRLSEFILKCANVRIFVSAV